MQFYWKKDLLGRIKYFADFVLHTHIYIYIYISTKLFTLSSGLPHALIPNTSVWLEPRWYPHFDSLTMLN